MSLCDLKQCIETIKDEANDAASYLDAVDTAVEYWERIEGEGWNDADEVVKALESVAELLEIKDELDMHPDDIRASVVNWREICGTFDEQGYSVSDSEEAKEVIETLCSQEGATEIIDAIKALVGALNRAGVLAGTVSGLGVVKVGHPKPAFEEPGAEDEPPAVMEDA